MEIEFKVTSDNVLAIKQARPWVFPPLTGRFDLDTAAHGGSPFMVRIRFSAPTTILRSNLRDRAVSVTGGRVTGARRTTYSRISEWWKIEVTPDSLGDVTIAVAHNRPCDNVAAICTSDGKRLSNRLERTIKGSLNNPATGLPTISGTAQVGETLTADTSGIVDGDGLENVSYSYQWLRNDGTTDSDIQDATDSTYALVSDDSGKAIKVRVSFTDDAGNAETLTSDATAVVAAATRPNNPATGAPTISGTAQVGETLTAETSGIDDDDGLSNATFSYQWIRNDGTDDADIPNATSASYLVVSPDDVGNTIKVRVTFTDNSGNEESLTSASTAAVNATVPGPPRSVDVQTSSSDQLSVSWEAPAFDGGSDITGYTIQWREATATWDSSADLSSAATTANSYTISSLSPGTEYTVRVMATNVVGDGPPSAEESVTPNNPATGAPTISGASQVGETLTAETSGIDDDDGLSNATFAYQWLRNDGTTDSGIQDATDSTYALVSEDTSKTIKVQVSFTDNAGNEESLTSASTAAVNATVPGPPRSVDVQTSSSDQLSVSWEAPAFNGGSDITGYTIQWREATATWDSSADLSSAATTANSYTINSLSPGTEYTVRVVATNVVGDGPPSAEESVTPNSPPTGQPVIRGTPQVGEALDADTSSISDADGLNDAIYAYQWLSDDTDISGATGPAYILTDSDQGTTIKVRVSFTDDAGNDESLTSEALDVPVRPHGLTAAVSDGAVVLTWKPPVGFSYLYDYQILRHRPELGETEPLVYANTGTAETTYTDTDVEPGVLYEYRVKAANFFTRLSKASEPVEIRTAEAAANTPATGAPAISGTAQVGETLTVDTSGITDANGLTNVEYRGNWFANPTEGLYSTGDGGLLRVAIVAGGNPSYTVSRRDVGLTLEIQVGFEDDAGNYERLTSAKTVVVTATTPAAPENFDVSATDTGDLDLSWNAPTWDLSGEFGGRGTWGDGGSSITGYVVQWKEASASWDTKADVSEATLSGTTHSIQGLTDDTEYVTRVIAVNGIGRGAPSDEETAALNRPATGTPAISGDLVVGQTLRVDTSAIEDADGLDKATFTYQWLADDTDIQNATDSTYILTDSEEGKAIKVTVSFTDDAGNGESLSSAATAAVEPAPTLLTAEFNDTPSSHDGDTAFTFELRFSEEFELSYKTLRDHACTVTGGEVTGARRLDRDSATPNIRWEITVAPDGNGDVTVVLPATTDCTAQGAICTGDGKMLSGEASVTVAGPEGEEQQTPPENNPATGAPAISGTARVGETLTADTSGIADSDGTGDAAFAYQWLADDTDILGATGDRYTLTDSEEGKAIKVSVSFTDDAGNGESLTSAATAAVEPAPTLLTAELLDTPSSHDGDTAFTFELRFSEEFELSYKTVRDHAFTVTGGEVTGARRLDRDSATPNIRWETTVAPDGNGGVTIVLPATTDCADQGAICTADGRMLSNRNQLSVSGPGS